MIRKPSEKLWVFTFIFLDITLFLLAFVGGYFIKDRIEIRRAQFPVLTEAYKILSEHALNDLPSTKNLEYGMIKGMLQANNEPNTVFIEPPQAALQNDQLKGKYGGIGVRLDRNQANDYIIFPLPDSPSLAAGVKDGDRLISVDTLSITKDTQPDIVETALRGLEKSLVKIRIVRSPDDTTYSFAILRKEVPLPSVVYNLVPDQPKFGYVQIRVIAETTPDEVVKGIRALEADGANHFVIDLRNNFGGLVSAGVDTARLFLAEGVVMQEQYRGEPVTTYKVERPGPFANLPLAILVNQGTASASEIIAGALMAQKRAILVGTVTYGKDTIQIVYELQDKSSLHVTAARWWIPGFNLPMGGNGLQPQIVLPEDQANHPQALKVAIDSLLLIDHHLTPQ